MIRKALQNYNYYLMKYPLPTKSITAGSIIFMSDLCSQKIQIKYGQLHNYDLVRSKIFFITGSLINGPANHLWNVFVLPFVESRLVQFKIRKIVQSGSWRRSILRSCLEIFLCNIPMVFMIISSVKYQKGEEIVVREILEKMKTISPL